MPSCHRDLGNDHGGLATVAVVKDFEQVSGLDGGQGVSEPVIEDKQMGTSQLGQQLRIGAISTGQFEGLQTSRELIKTPSLAWAIRVHHCELYG